MHARILAPLFATLLLVTGCASPEGHTPADQRAYTLKVRDEALAELAVREPESQALIASAPGYVFMSGFSLHPGLMTLGNAYGVIQNNLTGKQTYVRLTRFAVGPGLAIKGYYGVVTIDTPEALEKLEQGTWYGVAFADASFKFGETGGSASAGDTSEISSNAWLWTHTGFSIEVAAGGGKLYLEDELN